MLKGAEGFKNDPVANFKKKKKKNAGKITENVF